MIFGLSGPIFMVNYIVTKSFSYTPSDGEGVIHVFACREYWPGAPAQREIWQISVPTVYQARIAHNLEFANLSEACAVIADAFQVSPGDVRDRLVKTMRSF